MKQGLSLMLDTSGVFTTFGGAAPARDSETIFNQALELADHGYKPSMDNHSDQVLLDGLLDTHFDEIDNYRAEIKKKALAYYRHETSTSTHKLRRGLIVFTPE
ncbi:hypothetical protein KIV45_17150 [Janthinobacterium lividum]|nr:hypothetical protein KIV45_17150 [Janthinobacterium lividum]